MKYTASIHAIQRTVERIGINREHAENYLNQLMDTAEQIPHNGQETMFEHPKTKIRLVVNTKAKLIITVYPAQEKQYNALISEPHIIQSILDSYKTIHKHEQTDLFSLEIKRAEVVKDKFEYKLRYLRAVTNNIREELSTKIQELEEKEASLNQRITEIFNKIEKNRYEIKRVTGMKVADFID